MKIVLVGINAKYIHPNLAIRLLKANTKYPLDLKEYTIKDDYHLIINQLLDYDIIGFSCYIWNIEIIKKIICDLKTNYPNKIIILGGPEVSYNFSNEEATYIISNEGEEAFNLLLEAIIEKKNIKHIRGIITKDVQNTSKEIVNINTLNSPYLFDTNYEHKITYFETMRGCPFKCSYCLASLDRNVRYFDLDKVKENLLFLINQGAKTFKFLDRSFNINEKRMKEIMLFIQENAKHNSSFQFEIVGDLLTDDIITFLDTMPKHLFRFEIGIQTLNEKTNTLILRKQNNQKLLENLRKILKKDLIVIHLDLIAGLPLDNLNSFKLTFNEIIKLKPHELQLGFLKFLNGTKIKKEANLYDYQYQDKPPYEIISSAFLSKNDIFIIHETENILEKYYNSHFMPKTINYLIDNTNSCFDFFYDISLNVNLVNFHLDDLFKALYTYLKMIFFPNLEYVLFLMKQDYLTYHHIKPKIWWDKMDKKAKNHIIENLNISINKDDLYRYSVIETYQDKLLIALYKPNHNQIIIL